MPLDAEAPTREEALAKLRAALQDGLRNSAELVPLETSPQLHPLDEFAAMFNDDPSFEEDLEIMSENRHKMDQDAKVP